MNKMNDILEKQLNEAEEYESENESEGTIRSHKQDSSTSSIESSTEHTALSSSSSSSKRTLTPLKTKSTKPQNNNSTIHRKRLSMNFKTLPVMAPSPTCSSPGTSTTTTNNHHQSTGSISVNSPQLSNSSTFNHFNYSPSPENRRRRTISTDSSGTTNHRNSIHSPLASPSIGSTSITNTNNNTTTTTQDTYLATLASKERKVVELKDEVKRVKDLLKSAEQDLNNFRNQASFAIHMPTIENSNTGINTHDTTNDYFDNSSDTLKTPTHQQPVYSPATRSLDQPPIFGRSPTPPVPPHSHSHSHSQQQQYQNQQQMYNNINNRQSEVFIMGKRVVEELGTQFWGLFDDIKNATVGEEPRRPGDLSRKGSLRQQQNYPSTVVDHAPTNSNSHGRQNSNTNAAENSYYYI